MKNRTLRRWTGVFLWVLALALGGLLPSWAGEIRVFAAASLTDALKEMQTPYEAATGDKLIFNFAGSNVLARQIQEGAPADVFLSADEIQMNVLAKKGLVDAATRKSVLSNTLVVVVPDEGGAKIASLTDLKKVKRLALADPGAGVPAGVYAKAQLKKEHLWGDLIDKVIPCANVRAALAAVEYGNVDAGIVYKTDALASKKVKIAYEVPAASGPKISYPFAAVADSKDPKAAARFLAYAEGPLGTKIFSKWGFVPASRD
jgi:molybdate transport system substrate-binding protein